MFYETVVTDGDKIMYIPTVWGNGLLMAAIALLLAAAVVFAKTYVRKRRAGGNAGRDRRFTVRMLAFCAMSVALGTVLSNIKLFHFPTGGSVTLLSMLAVCLPGYWFGLGAGLMTGFAYGVLQLLIDPCVLSPLQLVVDYFLAFGALGLSGLFADSKNGLVKGYVAAVLGRYVFAVISGWIFFGMYAWEGWAPLPYSLAYNAVYIFTEAAASTGVLLLPPVKSALGRIRMIGMGPPVCADCRKRG